METLTLLQRFSILLLPPWLTLLQPDCNMQLYRPSIFLSRSPSPDSGQSSEVTLARLGSIGLCADKEMIKSGFEIDNYQKQLDLQMRELELNASQLEEVRKLGKLVRISIRFLQKSSKAFMMTKLGRCSCRTSCWPKISRRNPKFTLPISKRPFVWGCFAFDANLRSRVQKTDREG